MNDLIYRDQAIEVISKLPVKVDNFGYTWMIAGDALKQIDDIPSAEPERKKGELETVGFLTCPCSECGARFHELEYTNFCPNCGAKWSE